MDKTCKFWDMKSGVNTITLAAHESVIADMAATENGQILATCGWDKLIYLWDITTGMYRSHGPKALDKIHEGCISCVDFSSDGKILVFHSSTTSICLITMITECLLTRKYSNVPGFEVTIKTPHSSVTDS